MQFVNVSTGEVLGNDRGDFYFLFPEDLDDLAIYTPMNYAGVLNFTLTTVAREEDGDLATSEAFPFSVTFLQDPSNPAESDAQPLPPIVTIGNPLNATGNGTSTGDPSDSFNVGIEDSTLTIDIETFPADGDTSDPVITITLSDIPDGFKVTGAIYNPIEDSYSAPAADINDGKVQIIPPIDFGGFFNVTVQAVASAGLSASTEELTLIAYIDPIADGVDISVSTSGSTSEDVPFNTNVTLVFLSMANFRTGIEFGKKGRSGPRAIFCK